MTDLLLLNPPVAKPSEPPAGIARLAGAVRQHGYSCALADLNLEGLLISLGHPLPVGVDDAWSRRAWKNRERNLSALRQSRIYRSVSRYQKGVLELNRLLELRGQDRRGEYNLANYQDTGSSPLNSHDLLCWAEQPEQSLFFDLYRRRLPDLLERYNPRVVGLSISYISQALDGFALLGMLRRLDRRIKLVVGGGLITSWLRNGKIMQPFAGLADQWVAGPGERPLLQMLGEDQLAPSLPSYDGLPQDDYLSPGFVLPYDSSTGCFWNRCRFCPERAEGSPFRSIEPDAVVDSLSRLVAVYHPVLLHLLDSAIPPATLACLARSSPGVPWYGFVRLGRQLADPDFCRRLRSSGCVMLKIGLESGSQRVLDKMEKGTDLAMASAVLRSLAEAGIATYVYLLFGTPAESLVEARETLDFVKRHHALIGFLNLAVFNMPINSPAFDALETRAFSGDDMALYRDFVHPLGWDRRSVRRFLDQEFRRQPEIAAIVRRDPPYFTSNHAPFFCPGFAP